MCATSRSRYAPFIGTTTSPARSAATCAMTRSAHGAVDISTRSPAREAGADEPPGDHTRPRLELRRGDPRATVVQHPARTIGRPSRLAHAAGSEPAVHEVERCRGRRPPGDGEPTRVARRRRLPAYDADPMVVLAPDTKPLPPVERVRPGLWSVPVPLPIPLRYVFVYVFETDRGPFLVDAGWNTDDAYDGLCSGLEEAGTSISDVQGVMVTHIHPDHYGLAGRVRDASGAWIALHPRDAELVHDRYTDPTQLLERMGSVLRMFGAPPEELDELRNASMPVRPFVDAVEPDVLMEDGDRPEIPGWDVTALWTPGHSPGHLCFWEAGNRVMLTGDCVLPAHHPERRVPRAVGGRPARRLPPLARAPRRLRRRRSPPCARVPLHEPQGAPAPDPRPPRAALPRGDRRDPRRQRHHLGHRARTWTGRARGTRSPASCAARPSARPRRTCARSRCAASCAGCPATPCTGSSSTESTHRSSVTGQRAEARINRADDRDGFRRRCSMKLKRNAPARDAGATRASTEVDWTTRYSSKARANDWRA